MLRPTRPPTVESASTTSSTVAVVEVTRSDPADQPLRR